jgi:hypothetical protein
VTGHDHEDVKPAQVNELRVRRDLGELAHEDAVVTAW